ncbi:membrane protein [Fulvitalea axinellae]|uniref:Membrane protein n=1 Tax=Fulvitalea axinellae TaxID=1182444 RepID=A0AAU9CKU9_9BACT|nr:membrane protein [Fulvitalea axinellae]
MKTRIIFALALFAFSATGAWAQEALSLSQAIEIGLGQNYDIKISGQQEEVAGLQNTWGNAGMFPTLDFQASLTENWSGEDLERRNETIDPGLRMNWTVFNGFSVRINKARLAELEELSAGNTQVVIENTIKDIITTYYQALLEQERTAVAEKLAKLSSDRYHYTERQREIGTKVTYDLLQSQNAWLQDKSNLLQQRVNYKNAVRRLNFVMGIKEDKEYVLTEKFEFQAPDYSFGDLEEKMLSSNSTLKNQYIQQRLNRNSIRQAKSALYPRLSVGGGINKRYYPTAEDQGEIPAVKDDWGANVALTLSYNIFNGGNRKRAIEIAKINTEIGDIQTEQLGHSLSNQLAQNFDSYKVQDEILHLAIENQKAAELNLKLSEQRYKSGNINSFNLRDIEIAYLNASNSKLSAIYQLISIHSELLRMTGGIISQSE